MEEKNKKQKILIIGINGQDGSFLAEALSLQGYQIYGIGRSGKISKYLRTLNVTYYQCNLTELDVVEKIFLRVMPDMIIHTAAVNGAAGTIYESEWKQIYSVNIASAHAALEYARVSNKRPSIIYFSSAKVFDLFSRSPIDESSPRTVSCIYSNTKSTTENLIDYYRDNYGITASIIWLFNHDSSRKNRDFFLPKLVRCLIAAQEDPCHKETFNSLDFYCDWGCAKEYMEILSESIFEIGSQDFILASGILTNGRKLAFDLFSSYGLNFENHIACKYQADNPQKYLIVLNRARKLLKRMPIKSPLMICNDILHEIK